MRYNQIWISTLLLFCVFRGGDARRKRDKDTSTQETFLIPILWHGPNNQLTTIKETLAIARLLQPTAVAVLPDLQPHIWSDQSEGRKDAMYTTELIDVNNLYEKTAQVMLLRDLRRLWDGRLDVLVSFAPTGDDWPQVPRLVRAMGLQEVERDRWLHAPVGASRGCGAARVAALRALLAPHRFVGVLCFADLGFQADRLAGPLMFADCGGGTGGGSSGNGSSSSSGGTSSGSSSSSSGIGRGERRRAGAVEEPEGEGKEAQEGREVAAGGGDACCRALRAAGGMLRKSRAVVAMAGEFVARHLGGRGATFVAAHIRPYPDTCFEAWERPDAALKVEDMEGVCSGFSMAMYKNLAPAVLELQRRHRAPRVFLMAHPVIRHRVARMLQEGGVTGLVFADMSIFNSSSASPSTSAAPSASAAAAAPSAAPSPSPHPLRTPPSLSLLGMVEEAVAEAAAAFLASPESSMSGVVVQSRLVAGLPPSSCFYFSREPECAARLCGLGHYYRPGGEWELQLGRKVTNRPGAAAGKAGLAGPGEEEEPG